MFLNLMMKTRFRACAELRIVATELCNQLENHLSDLIAMFAVKNICHK